NGVAWEPTREIFRKRYIVEHIFSSHDPERWNFSDSTDLSEVMVVARKIDASQSNDSGRTTYINLYHNPTNIIEALNVAHQLQQVVPGKLEASSGAAQIRIGDKVEAEVVSLPWSTLKADGSFMWGTAFAQSDLIRVLLNLVDGRVLFPGMKKPVD